MENILKAISEVPGTIASLESDNLEIKRQCSKLKEQMDGIRKSTWAEVANEKEDGKKVYPNAEMRDIEVERRLAESNDYQENVISLEVFEAQKARNEIKLQQLINQFSVDRYKLRLYTAEKTERAATTFNEGLNTLYHLGKIITTFKAIPEFMPREENCPF
ncbi:hypothetical protein ASZ90_019967 [hydrocarbon metagenome]|uniref:Uncharacterized protein n=1 Tax=hydrocarbon metagenome TaxID=938273 RepID=A0A0W8E1P8_9ZZZZ